MSLFDDRTAENIKAELFEDLNEAIEELPDNQKVSAAQGSFLDLSIGKYAVLAEELYADMDEVNDNMLVDTQDAEHLVDSGVEYGIPINEGTPAVVIADLNCLCDIGTEFSAVDSDYNYIVVDEPEIINTDDGTIYRYRMEADEEGIDPGNYRGDIEPVDYLDGFEEGAVTNIYAAGTEQEDIETYRERRLMTYTSKACAGNYDYYREVIGDIAGVGGVKVVRRQTMQSYIPCYIQADDYGVPTQTLLDSVKTTMDPDLYEGEGMGLAPMGHVLQVNAVTGVTINVAASFTFDEGYSFSMLETALKKAVSDYITEQAKTWQNSGSIVIRQAVVESALLGVTGVIDIDDVTLNDSEENITTTAYQVPVFGTLTEVS